MRQRDSCQASHVDGWMCTEPFGHAGEHIASGGLIEAGGDGRIYKRWPPSDPEMPAHKAAMYIDRRVPPS